MFSLEALFVFFVLFAIVVGLAASVRILREYERAVVFTLGRFERVKGPGLVLLMPFIQEMVRVDLRIQVIEIPSQDVISHDNVSMNAHIRRRLVEHGQVRAHPLWRLRQALQRARDPCAARGRRGSGGRRQP